MPEERGNDRRIGERVAEQAVGGVARLVGQEPGGGEGGVEHVGGQ